MAKRYESSYATRRAERRRLRIFASDPMSGRRRVNRITIDIENENLEPGPRGQLVEVWDYDTVHDVYYAQIDLNNRNHLMEDGLAPNESDPRFHQQMVYAVVMRVIETASRALGRPLSFYRGTRTPRLRILPHGFHGENAFFDPNSNALIFGYFQAQDTDAGPNIPGQIVYTCLSHDIVAHEMTHAIVHRLRRYFIEPTNPDVHAFHEGFSDIVAILVKFTYRDLVAEFIRAFDGRLWEADVLVDLAQQFGFARGTGEALRTAYAEAEPDPGLFARTTESHARGAILLGAVFDGFFAAYKLRIGGLLRIGDGGRIAGGDLHPDLVKRITEEVTELADRVLRMCFRAFDYMPPIDVTFSDFLRALVTSDYELDPEDRDELRFHLVEGFRRRGIYPRGVKSLAEESLLWPEGNNGLPALTDGGRKIAQSYLGMSALALDELARGQTAHVAGRPNAPVGDALLRFQKVEMAIAGKEAEIPEDEDALDDELKDLETQVAVMLHDYAETNAALLGLANPETHTVSIAGFHAVQRQAKNGRLLIEFVVQVVQKDETDIDQHGGVPQRAGATIVFTADGVPRYVISKPMPGLVSQDSEITAHAADREAAFRENLELMDAADPRMAFEDPAYDKSRMTIRAAYRALHESHD